MYLIREIMYCKPGKVRALVEKFTAMNKLSERVGMPRMRIMTDFCAERYWTIVSEMEVTDLNAFEQMMSNPAGSAEDMKEFENIMKGYHDLVDHGKREIYKIESEYRSARRHFRRQSSHSETRSHVIGLVLSLDGCEQTSDVRHRLGVCETYCAIS